MPKRLTRAEIDRYGENGVLFPKTVLSAAEAAGFRRRLDEAEARYGRVHYMYKPYLVLMVADEIVHDTALLDMVEDLIGPNILLWDAAFVIKEPGAGGFFSWHQDLTYWGLEPPDVVSAWIALSPATPESGCMRMIAGSHKGGILPHRDTYGRDNMLTRGQEIAVEVDQARAVDIVLAPGEVSFHHGRVIHASNPNRSPDRRIGLTIQFIPPHVRQAVGKDDTAMLVRGTDDHGNFELEPRPGRDFDPVTAALQSRMVAVRNEVLYKVAAQPPA